MLDPSEVFFLGCRHLISLHGRKNYGFPHVSCVWDSLGFLDLWGFSFQEGVINLYHYFFKVFSSSSSLSFPVGVCIYLYIGPLQVVLQLTDSLFIFKHSLFSLFHFG